MSKLNLPNPPKDKKAYFEGLGKILVKTYGKQRFYSTDQVINADKLLEPTINKNLPWWGMCVYCSNEVFWERYKYEFGVDPTTEEIKRTKLNVLADLVDPVEISLHLGEIAAESVPVESWLDFSILGDIFEGTGDLFMGISEVIVGILSSLTD